MIDNKDLELAKKENLNIEEMIFLSNSKDWEVRVEIAKKPNLHPYLMEKFSRDKSESVQGTIAGRSDLLSYKNIIDYLFEECNHYISSILVNNPIFDGKEEWLYENYKQSHRSIAMKESLPICLKEKLSQSENYLIRSGIAEHHELTDDLFLKLLLDKNYQVRQKIVSRDNFFEEIKPFLK